MQSFIEPFELVLSHDSSFVLVLWICQDDEMSNMQKLLIAIVSILVALSVVLCVLVFLYLKFWAAHTEDTKEALSFTVVVLVASIPMVCFAFFFGFHHLNLRLIFHFHLACDSICFSFLFFELYSVLEIICSFSDLNSSLSFLIRIGLCFFGFMNRPWRLWPTQRWRSAPTHWTRKAPSCHVCRLLRIWPGSSWIHSFVVLTFSCRVCRPLRTWPGSKSSFKTFFPMRRRWCFELPDQNFQIFSDSWSLERFWLTTFWHVFLSVSDSNSYSMSILCSDKTGTLTTNHMEIQEEIKAYHPGIDRHQLLRYCAMVCSIRHACTKHNNQVFRFLIYVNIFHPVLSTFTPTSHKSFLFYNSLSSFWFSHDRSWFRWQQFCVWLISTTTLLHAIYCMDYL